MTERLQRIQLGDLETAPWNSHPYDKKIFTPCNMLAHNEAPFLYYLAKKLYTGLGCIVDAGSFTGGSANCLACGIIDNPELRDLQRPVIHCFDRFIVDSEFTRQFLLSNAGVDRPIGSSFFDLFQKYTKSVADQLRVHPGDFLAMSWSGERIEVLFVDLCKTRELNSHLLRETFHCLIPGVSWVIQQDYYHPFLPWIHITMEYLADYFEALDFAIGDTRVFRLVREIPREVTDQCAAYSFSFTEQLELMDAAIARVCPPDRGCVLLAKALLLWNNGMSVQARSQVEELGSYFDNLGQTHKWTNYFQTVQNIMRD